MFKTLFVNYVKNMSTEKKIKDTLAKKLKGKGAPQKLDKKVDQVAESKSPYFKETQNVKNKVGMESMDTSATTMPVPSDISVKRSTRKIKVDVDNTNLISSMEIVKTKSTKASKSNNKNKSPAKEDEEASSSKKTKQELLEEKWQPPNWSILLENIRIMRANYVAPVDTMGCHKCADEKADKKTQRFHKLIALMLSSQTKDETTYHAMLRLREQNLTPEVICNMKLGVLENILHPVSFYKNKAKYMQQTSKILIEKYNSDIPNNIKELVALPGVGPKMAHICMATSWDKVTGIGVDVHVHRIANRIGWLRKPTKEPEQTRSALEAWLPQHLWREVNHLLVGFGQTVCTPVKPKCIQCLNFEMCPSAIKVVKK